MKRFVNVMAFMLFMVGIKAQVRDAFDGILPVTDPQMKRSLNGEWQLKVVQGISDDQTLPMADETWGCIPVPGCWEAYGFWDVSYHINQIYAECEQDPERTHKKFLLVRQEGNRSARRNMSHYNLDMIIAVPIRLLTLSI